MALALASAGAVALGLGEIEVKSGPGQPFLAEIPIIAAEPGEIESAQARLASPETFARVGLQPPQGLVGDLQFQVTRNAHGHAVVRVTSAAPVDLPALSFLIEVDWGRGRLVREYSALIDAPRVAAAQPVIETPMALPADTIPRPASAQAATVAASPQPAAPASPQAAPRPVTPALEPPASVAVGDGAQITVAPGQTLYSIASELQAGTEASVPQWMMGLLRANPQAFIGDNINRLKAGAVLQAPTRAELQTVNAAQAQALVREHVARWRQASAPLPQPADPGTGTGRRSAATTPGAPSAPVATQNDARLQIAPAVASGTERTMVQPGAGADGGGDMVTTEQLRQAREDLATRDVEMQELRARVAELERLQQQQMQLIALKDDDLAAAQQRLAQQQAQSTDTALPVWIWVLLAALVAAVVLAWLLGQRRKPSPFGTRTAVDRAALAAAMPAAPAAAIRPLDAEPPGAAAVPPPPAAAPPFAHSPPAVPAPAWTAGSTASSTESAPLPGPTWHRGDAASRIAPLNPAPAGRERLELAVAYLDLGDVETARDLLHEVVEGGDETLRAEAARRLRDIG